MARHTDTDTEKEARGRLGASVESSDLPHLHYCSPLLGDRLKCIIVRTLVIPDIHNHLTSADRWIAEFPADRILFLGDYFDSFDDTAEMAEATARWLKASLRQPNRLHLWGNHDLAYAFPMNRHLRCSGVSEEKEVLISTILTGQDWDQLKLFHAEGETLFTHAGLDPTIFAHPIDGITVPRLESLCQKAMTNARAGLRDPVLDLSGLTWLRWWEITVLEEFNQVVGHTPDPKIRIRRSGDRFNAGLDTFGHYVGMLDGTQFSYIDTRSKRVYPIA